MPEWLLVDGNRVLVTGFLLEKLFWERESLYPATCNPQQET
jgi:hypothetical protein